METFLVSIDLEKWRDIVGYEGWYQVSNLGRVKRVKSGPNTYTGRILKTFSSRGYPMVWLYKDGKSDAVSVHTLVLEAFGNSRPSGYECNHKNGDKSDNRMENLEWVTHSENMKHAYRVLGRRQGGQENRKGENNNNARQTTQEVLKIRELYEAGEHTQRELGKMFGCSDVNICYIVNRRTWKHV